MSHWREIDKWEYINSNCPDYVSYYILRVEDDKNIIVLYKRYLKALAKLISDVYSRRFDRSISIYTYETTVDKIEYKMVNNAKSKWKSIVKELLLNIEKVTEKPDVYGDNMIYSDFHCNRCREMFDDYKQHVDRFTTHVMKHYYMGDYNDLDFLKALYDRFRECFNIIFCEW